MTNIKLIIESGPSQGKTVEVPAEGLSVGRAAQNDLAIPDGQLSRHHCKVYFVGGKLFVADLASANGTVVNNRAVEAEAAALGSGDRIAIGDTVLRVEGGGPRSLFPQAASGGGAGAPGERSAKGDAPSSGVDLGLSGGNYEKGPAPTLNKKSMIYLAAGFVIFCGAAFAVKTLLSEPGGDNSPRPVAEEQKDDTLEIRYTKVEGSEANIFKYELTLDAAGNLAVSIDDIAQSRHVRKASEKPVEPALVRELARKFERARFHSFDDAYEGIPRANSWNTRKLTGIVNNRAKTVSVRNKLMVPSELDALCDEIEVFARAELGLFSIEFSREKLIELARDSHILGARLSAERDIRPSNLYESMRALKLAISYLDTIEPKPEFYDDAVVSLARAEEDLDAMWNERNFRAEHSVRTKDWAAAAQALRELLQIVPDRANERYRDAERRLLDAEARLKKTRR